MPLTYVDKIDTKIATDSFNSRPQSSGSTTFIRLQANTEADVRFLPPLEGKAYFAESDGKKIQVPYLKFLQHSIKVGDSFVYAICGQGTNNTCEWCEHAKELQRGVRGNEARKEWFKKAICSTTRALWNVFDRDTSSVKIYSASYGAQMKLLDYLKPKYLSILNPIKGCDVTLKADSRRVIDPVKHDVESSLSKDMREIEAILEGQHNLTEFAQYDVNESHLAALDRAVKAFDYTESDAKSIEEKPRENEKVHAKGFGVKPLASVDKASLIAGKVTNNSDDDIPF